MKKNEKELEQFLLFAIDQQQFAIELIDITEIGEYLPVMPIPKAYKYILGVLNLRGIIVPIISLRKRFKLSDDQITQDSGIVYVKKDNIIYGILVDKIDGIVKFAIESIGKVPKIFKEKIDIAYFKGMSENNKEKVIILNTDALFE
ncbi:chemotaxis protein CheW [candidate division WOR-3 bacterium]|jgi:purine-binding chemotaxis protein CheW|nr:chemotaxis protein CheW [candidate division WOR-3 bacterium]